MTWRSIVVSRPATLRFRAHGLLIEQPTDAVTVPLEDIAVVVLESAEILLSSRLLQECADAGIAVITVGRNHHPNGALLPFLPHSRPLKMLKRQLDITEPRRKRLWQAIVRQKLHNQARCLELLERDSPAWLHAMAERVRSGDPDNVEATAARPYFRSLFGEAFRRSGEDLINSALDYGYAILRAAIARSLTLHGFLPVLGLHHRNEQNAFNLADDVLEPFRALVDLCVAQYFLHINNPELSPAHKVRLIGLLHQDLPMPGGCLTALAAIEDCVVSLGQCLEDSERSLRLPGLRALAEPAA